MIYSIFAYLIVMTSLTHKSGGPYITIEQIIFHFLWDHWAHCGMFEKGVLLMHTLQCVRNVAYFITAYEESQ